MENLAKKVKDLDTIGLLDNRIQELSFNILQEGTERNWPKVVEGFRELAYICKTKGLNRKFFLMEIRKPLIQTIEHYEPFAKLYIQSEERTHVKH